MRAITALTILAIAFFILSGYGNSAAKKNGEAVFTNISAQEAKNRLDQESGIILLDVRTAAEYMELHIPGSLLIPVDDLEREALSVLPDKNAPIFIYCRSGRRSVTAANILLKLGYTDVYNLGGIIDWPYETATGSKE